MRTKFKISENIPGKNENNKKQPSSKIKNESKNIFVSENKSIKKKRGNKKKV